MKKFDLPKDWSWKALGECCEIVNGSTPRRSNDEYWGGSIKWVTPTEVGAVEGKYLDDSEEKITEEGYESCSTTLLPENSVIYSSRASIGHIAINNVPVCTNQGFKSFVTGDAVDPEYLYYCLKWKTPEIEHIADGSTYTEISKRDMSKVEIPLPPLGVQRRIVTVLDRADALRTKRRQFFERLPSLTQSFYIDLFGDPFENPRDWETCELGDVIEKGPRNGLYRPQDDYGSGTPIIRIDSFYGGEIVDPENLKRVEIDDETRQKYLVEEGDILINRVNSREYLGKSALVRDLPEPTVFESNMMRLRLDRDLIEPGYLIGLLQQEYINRQIQTAAKDAVNQSSINQSDVKEFEIRVPPLKLQRKYVELRNRIRGTQKRAKRHQKRVDDLFNALLHRAFRGELELNETAFETETETLPSEEKGRAGEAIITQGNLFSEAS